MYGEPASGPCYACGRPWGFGNACQFCSQLYGFPTGVLISSAGRRFGAHLLEALLIVVTLFIGHLIWSLLVFANGQTPAKQILGMRVVTVTTGAQAGWGRMFVREVVAKTLIAIFAGFAFYVPYFWLLWDRNRQQLWDKLVDTVVVDDPTGLVGSQPQPMLAQQPWPLPPAPPQYLPAPTQYLPPPAPHTSRSHTPASLTPAPGPADWGQGEAAWSEPRPATPPPPAWSYGQTAGPQVAPPEQAQTIGMGTPPRQPARPGTDGRAGPICRSCGHQNSPSRQTCKACRAPL